MEHKQEEMTKRELYYLKVQSEFLNAGIPICFCIDDSFSMWRYRDMIRSGIERFLKNLRRNTLYEESVYISFVVANRETKITKFELAKQVMNAPTLHPRGSVSLPDLLQAGMDMLNEFEKEKQRVDPILVLFTDGNDVEKEWERFEAINEQRKENGYQLLLVLPGVFSVSKEFEALNLEEDNIAYFQEGSSRDFSMMLYEWVKSNSDSGERSDIEKISDGESDGYERLSDHSQKGFGRED